MKKKLENKISRTLSICLLVAVLLIGSSVGLAAYTNARYQKGVAAATSYDVAFSSNLLSCYLKSATLPPTDSNSLNSYKTRLYFSADSQSSVSQSFTVNNFAQGTSSFSKEDIKYTLKASAEYSNAYSGTPLSVDSTSVPLNGNSVTISTYNLSGGEKNTNNHTITIPVSALNNVTLTVTATPSDSTSMNATRNHILSKQIIPIKYSSEGGTQWDWQYSLPDSSSGNSSKEYSAINFELTGTVGTGNITLSWTNDVELDPYFRPSGCTYSKSERTITFPVDAENKGYYLVQFYRTGKTSNSETWNTVSSYITYSEEHN